MTSRKIGKGEDFLAGILSRAIELRGDEIEIEYKNGYEEIFAIHNCLGRGIGRIESDSEEARSLRQLLHKVEKKTWGLPLRFDKSIGKRNYYFARNDR